jgi:hypothetical protein
MAQKRKKSDDTLQVCNDKPESHVYEAVGVKLEGREGGYRNTTRALLVLECAGCGIEVILPVSEW